MCDKQSIHQIPTEKMPGNVERKEYSSQVYQKMLDRHAVFSDCNVFVVPKNKEHDKFLVLSFRTSLQKDLKGVGSIESQVNMYDRKDIMALRDKLDEALDEMGDDAEDLGFV